MPTCCEDAKPPTVTAIGMRPIPGLAVLRNEIPAAVQCATSGDSYVTAAQLGQTGFDNAGNFISRPFPSVDGQSGVQHAYFYAPGAPRLFCIGIGYSFDQPEK